MLLHSLIWWNMHIKFFSIIVGTDCIIFLFIYVHMCTVTGTLGNGYFLLGDQLLLDLTLFSWQGLPVSRYKRSAPWNWHPLLSDIQFLNCYCEFIIHFHLLRSSIFGRPMIKLTQFILVEVTWGLLLCFSSPLISQMSSFEYINNTYVP